MNNSDKSCNKLGPVAAALGTSLVISLATIPTAQATQDAFSVTPLSHGYQLAEHHVESSCGAKVKETHEGTCGGDIKGQKEGSCGGDTKTESKDSNADPKGDKSAACGAGVCGANHPSSS